MSDLDTIGGDEIFIVQIATLGGGKLGTPDDPEGAWTDNDVYFDRAAAEAQARLHETLPISDAAGKDITREVVTTARVITMRQLKEEFGDDRMHVVLTTFRSRIAELMEARRQAAN
jgi:hypothetical protein